MVASRPPLSVSFHNFWTEFRAEKSFFAKALAQSYDVNVGRIGKDLQISSVFGTEPLPPAPGSRPLRVWWTGEARDPHGQIFDLYFGFRQRTNLLGARWFRYPLWITFIDWWDAASNFHVGRLTGERRARRRPRFCNFIYSADWSIRGEFFQRLNAARHVDSCGRILNNTGHRVIGRSEKLAVLAESTFTIAFENQIAPGYVTEKLVEPLLAGSVPIYWGAEEARTDFNPDAFIFAEDFGSMDDLVRHVVRLADSPDELAALAMASPFPRNRIPYEHTPDFFVDRITDALSGTPEPAIDSLRRGPWRSLPLPFANTLKRAERKIRRWRDRLRGKV